VDGGGVTEAGVEVGNRLQASTIDCLRELVDDWEPGADAELDERLGQLAEELPPPEPEPLALAGSRRGDSNP
jgi:hypothetical protein